MTQPIRPPRLYTLGRLSLEAPDGRVVVSQESAKLLAMLAYLTAAPRREASRDRLIDLFWADRPAAKARPALRQLLFRLRAVLGPQALGTDDGDRISLLRPPWTDREAFLAAVAQGDLTGAVEYYRGPFVPGMMSAGSAEFEHWADAERDRLQDLFIGLCELEARQALAQGQHRAALDLSGRILEVDGLEQRAWRIRLEAESRCFPPARRMASIVELRRLANEAGIPLEARTIELLARLEDHPTPAARATDPVLHGELVGRVPQWQAFDRAWRDASAGRAAHLHIAAPAGLGKTRLLTEWAGRLGAMRRVRVVLLRAAPRQRDLPWSAAADVVSQLAALPGATGVSGATADVLVDLAPSLGGRFPGATPRFVPDQGERDRLRTEAILDLVAAVAHDAPLALLLDDLHWWDGPSRGAVGAIAARIRDLHLLTITAARPETVSPGGPQLGLDPLSPAEVRALLASLQATGEDRTVTDIADALWATTGGSPLLVTEALRLGLARDAVRVHEGLLDFTSARDFFHALQPDSLLQDRIGRLAPDERRALELATVLGTPVPATASIASGMVDGFLALERRGLIVKVETGWALVHDTVGEAVLANQSLESCLRSHADAAEVLSAPNERLARARHLLIARDIPALVATAVPWIRDQRQLGDRRATRLMIDELLGPGAAPTDTNQVLRALPWPLRQPSRLLPHIAWAATVLLVAGGVWTMAGGGTGNGTKRPIEFTIVAVDSLSQFVSEVISVQLAEGERPLEDASVDRRRVPVAPGLRRESPGTVWGAAAGPDDKLLLSVADASHNGPTSFELWSGSSARRVALAPGDDAGADWSPDGNRVVFHTTRYPEGRGSFDLAVLDLRTDEVEQLFGSEDAEMVPRWSPEGARVAFIRKPALLTAEELCWIALEAGRPRCRSLPGVVLETIEGWDGPGAIYFSRGTPAGRQIWRWDLTSDEIRPAVDRNVSGSCPASDDGRWLLCPRWVSQPDGPRFELVLHDMRSPGSELRVGADGLTALADVQWGGGTSDHDDWRLETHASLEMVPGIAVSPEVRLVGTGRAPWRVPPELVAWHVSDSTFLSQHAGRLRALRPGTATAYASMGGVRSPVMSLTARLAPDTVALNEEWGEGWRERWSIVGEPPPEVRATAWGGPALLVNGDNDRESGVISTVAFSTEHGVALETTLSTPINRPWWQKVTIGLNHREFLTKNLHSATPCVARLPNGEGTALRRQLAGASQWLTVDSTIVSGSPWRLRLQLFPDGGCGIAIDGVPVLRSGTGTRPDSFVIGILGQSVGTEIFVGRLRVWQGVPAGVDWNSMHRGPGPE